MSAFAKTPMQAVMLVPLLLIPQILFSGFTVPAEDMTPPVLALSQIMPSFASERIADVSFLIDQEDFRRTRRATIRAPISTSTTGIDRKPASDSKRAWSTPNTPSLGRLLVAHVVDDRRLYRFLLVTWKKRTGLAHRLKSRQPRTLNAHWCRSVHRRIGT